MKVTILCVVGTRPEVIKMAPVILALQKTSWANVRVLATAQHREMLDETLTLFGIVPDFDLDIMRPDQTLADLTARLLTGIDTILANQNPIAVLAQGDTTTVLVTGLACFYRKIPFCHLEAGLRTYDFANPFPEEMNRSIAAKFATLHFAPTEKARDNLLQEGIAEKAVIVTGNTVIDALFSVAKRDVSLNLDLPDNKRIVLLTAHRRESFGEPLAEIFSAICTLTERYPELHVVYPVHPNPNVSVPASIAFANKPGVTLCAPLDYGRLVLLMKRSWLVLTDSGGLQEEAPALAKPVLVLRNETERPEALEAGVAQLVGHGHDRIVGCIEELLTNEAAYQSMAKGASPYGDGRAAARVVSLIAERFV